MYVRTYVYSKHLCTYVLHTYSQVHVYICMYAISMYVRIYCTTALTLTAVHTTSQCVMYAHTYVCHCTQVEPRWGLGDTVWNADCTPEGAVSQLHRRSPSHWGSSSLLQGEPTNALCCLLWCLWSTVLHISGILGREVFSICHWNQISPIKTFKGWLLKSNVTLVISLTREFM